MTCPIFVISGESQKRFAAGWCGLYARFAPHVGLKLQRLEAEGLRGSSIVGGLLALCKCQKLVPGIHLMLLSLIK